MECYSSFGSDKTRIIDYCSPADKTNCLLTVVVCTISLSQRISFLSYFTRITRISFAFAIRNPNESNGIEIVARWEQERPLIEISNSEGSKRLIFCFMTVRGAVGKRFPSHTRCQLSGQVGSFRYQSGSFQSGSEQDDSSAPIQVFFNDLIWTCREGISK